MMYLYRYTDEKGGFVYVEQPMKDYKALKTHRGRPVKRVIGGVQALHFKGTGFYLTDYKGK